MYWTTDSGKRLLIAKMESSHIFNCIRMVERMAWRGTREETVKVIEETVPEYAVLCEELKARFLDGRVSVDDLMLKHLIDGVLCIHPTPPTTGEMMLADIPDSFMFATPGAAQLSHILLSLREWFQDSGMEPSNVQLRIDPKDWPTFDKIVWKDDPDSGKIDPNVCIGFCGFNFRPAQAFDAKYEEQLRKCESVQRLVANVCGKLDEYQETYMPQTLKFAVIQKVRRELSNLGPALDALHRAFVEGKNGYAAVKHTTTEKDSEVEVNPPQSELRGVVGAVSETQRSQP